MYCIPIFIADPSVCFLTIFRIDSGFRGYHAYYPLLAHDNFWGYFGYQTSYGLPSSPVIGHFEFHRIAYFQVFDCSVELAEVKEQPRLSVTTLDESVRVL